MSEMVRTRLSTGLAGSRRGPRLRPERLARSRRAPPGERYTAGADVEAPAGLPVVEVQADGQQTAEMSSRSV